MFIGFARRAVGDQSGARRAFEEARRVLGSVRVATWLRATVGAAHAALALGDGTAGATNGVAAVLGDRSLVRRVDDQNRFFEVELAPGASAQLLLERLVSAGAQIRRFELVQPSLHQIFLQRVGATGVEEGLSGQG